MKVIVKSAEKWVYSKKWLDELKSEFHRQLPNRKIWIIFENKLQEDYLIKINGGTGKITVQVNTLSSDTINLVFKQGYLKALVAHEISHLQPNVIFHHDIIPAPERVFDSEGAEEYRRLTDTLCLKFGDFLTDVYANSGMKIDDLKKYLDFESAKITSYWGSMKNKERIIRAPLMLFTSYIEACYHEIGETTPEGLLAITKLLNDDESNIAIYKQMMTTYHTMWGAVKKGDKDVDLSKETFFLNKLLTIQLRPFLLK